MLLSTPREVCEQEEEARTEKNIRNTGERERE
jgi:hypothetical protein